jgi:hypothetical protein
MQLQSNALPVRLEGFETLPGMKVPTKLYLFKTLAFGSRLSITAASRGLVEDHAQQGHAERGQLKLILSYIPMQTWRCIGMRWN